MKGLYGRLQYGSIPPDVIKEYQLKGWLALQSEDGRQVFKWVKREGYEDAIQKSYLKSSENVVEPLARDFIAYLRNLVFANL